MEGIYTRNIYMEVIYRRRGYIPKGHIDGGTSTHNEHTHGDTHTQKRYEYEGDIYTKEYTHGGGIHLLNDIHMRKTYI